MTMAAPRFADHGLGDRRVPPARPGADHPRMDVIPMTPSATAGATIRCECAACGAHVIVRRSWQLSGQCGNCRSYDLRALQPPPPRPPVLAFQPRAALPLPDQRVA